MIRVYATQPASLELKAAMRCLVAEDLRFFSARTLFTLEVAGALEVLPGIERFSQLPAYQRISCSALQGGEAGAMLIR